MTLASGVRLGLLICVVALLGWLVWKPPTTNQPADEPLPNAFLGQPDLYMLDAEITQYTDTGSIKYVLQTEHLRHFEADGMTRMTAPELLLRGEAQAPWQVRSDQGFIRREPGPTGTIEEVVYLRSDVKLRQQLTNGQFLTLRGPSLYVYPDREFAQTNDNVMIDTEGGRTTGTGLAIDLAASTLKVFSQPPDRVQTIILPDQFK